MFTVNTVSGSPIILLMDKILHHHGWWLSHHFLDFNHFRWCRISSINSTIIYWGVYPASHSLDWVSFQLAQLEPTGTWTSPQIWWIPGFGSGKKTAYHGNVHLPSWQQTRQWVSEFSVQKHRGLPYAFLLSTNDTPLVAACRIHNSLTTKTGVSIFSTTWKSWNIAPFKSSIIRDVFLVEICWKSHLSLGVKSCYFVDFGKVFLDVLGLNFMGQLTDTWMVS